MHQFRNRIAELELRAGDWPAPWTSLRKHVKEGTRKAKETLEEEGRDAPVPPGGREWGLRQHRDQGRRTRND